MSSVMTDHYLQFLHAPAKMWGLSLKKDAFVHVSDSAFQEAIISRVLMVVHESDSWTLSMAKGLKSTCAGSNESVNT
jgi:hypothetical protein